MGPEKKTFPHKLEVAVPRAATLLRIQTTNNGVSQMQYAPGTSTDAGYGFMFLFQQGAVADGNGTTLEQCSLAVRIQPGAISQFDLAILSRLLQPFNGFVEMGVMGSYTAQVVNGQNQSDVLVDSISSTNIQPA